MFEEMTEQQAREQILEMTKEYCEKYHNQKKPYEKGDRIPYASRVYDADEINTLYLQFDGEDGEVVPGFYTKIYYYDGYIREILCAEDGGLLPEDGNEILAAEGLQISKAGNLISFSVTNEDGTESSMKIAVRSGGMNDGTE